MVIQNCLQTLTHDPFIPFPGIALVQCQSVSHLYIYKMYKSMCMEYDIFHSQKKKKKKKKKKTGGGGGWIKKALRWGTKVGY